ncbi:methyltransferase family protein [Parabacteroides sp. FAFU027]|uniref:methyltransferase family protein n=1 Tax=Parabacteroides sp. FAFU027 TaxID=2922715 RepID=UPI001FAFB9CA|nr:isoprenylcysteine carboxylmethyltransferase family protein [Parabacteroides sp. FAFU027]
MMSNLIRHILGYTLGLTMFGILIPMGLVNLGAWDHSVTHISLIESQAIRWIIATPFLVVGAVFAIWSNIFLFNVGKGGPAQAFNISISPKTKKLVTTGPYRYSRNPMMFGAFTLYFGVGILQNSLICLLTVLAFFTFMSYMIKFSEEKRLLDDFGDEYLEYKKKVSRFIPMKRARSNVHKGA